MLAQHGCNFQERFIMSCGLFWDVFLKSFPHLGCSGVAARYEYSFKFHKFVDTGIVNNNTRIKG